MRKILLSVTRLCHLKAGSWSLQIIGRRGQLKEEYRFGRLALQLLDRFNAREWQCRVVLLLYFRGRQKLQDQAKPLESAHRVGLVVGDINVRNASLSRACDLLVKLIPHACPKKDSMVCASRLCRVCFFASVPLPQVVKVLEEYRSLCRQYSQHGVETMLIHQLQMCYNLMGRSIDPLLLTGEVMNEEQTIGALQGVHMSTLAWLLIMKHMLAVYFNEDHQAITISRTLSNMKTGAVMPVILRIHLFHENLSVAAISRRSNTNKSARTRRMLENLRSSQDGNIENFENKIFLVEAEMISGNNDVDQDVAMTKYQQSIEAAQREGFLHEQALAREMVGRALLRWNKKVQAREYLVSAQSLYHEWGAEAKANQIGNVLSNL
jgi:hypothetical protein